jgi:hypothetical protein
MFGTQGGAGSPPWEYYSPLIMATATGVSQHLLGHDSYFVAAQFGTAAYSQVTTVVRAIIDATSQTVADPGVLAWSNGNNPSALCPIGQTVRAGQTIYFKCNTLQSQVILFRVRPTWLVDLV